MSAEEGAKKAEELYNDKVDVILQYAVQVQLVLITWQKKKALRLSLRFI